jgi:hypothetical protein
MAGAAFLVELQLLLERAVEACSTALPPIQKAHWRAVAEAAKPKEADEKGGGGLSFLFGKHQCQGESARL